MLIGVLALVAILSLGGWVIRRAREQTRINQCQGNLKHIALALCLYHDIYKTFPPAVFLGPDGRPWHSWRTAISNLMTDGPFYDQYWNQNNAAPWNSPKQQRAAKDYCFTSFYHCPLDSGPETDTSYLAVTGPGTMWPDNGSIKIADIRDGTVNTIMIVEVTNSGIHWMEPRDLRIDEMDFKINGKPSKSISSNHLRGAAVIFADGHVETLGPDTAKDTLEKWLLISDECDAIQNAE